MLLRLAWRNLWRQRSRTLILISAVTFSYALLLVSMGIGDDSHRQMLDAAVEGAGGDILVHRDGYWATLAGDLVIRDAEPLTEQLAGIAGVEAAVPRIRLPSLLSTSTGARAMEMLAVDPAREALLVDPHEHLVQGERLDETGLSGPVLLGVELAEDLDVTVGDRVVLTASDPEGELRRALFRVAGLLESGIRQLDASLAYTTLAAMQEALESPGTVTQIGLVLEPGTRLDMAAQGVRDAVAGRTPALEVLTWEEAVPEMLGFIETDDAFLYIYAGVIFVVVAFAIANTFLVAVTERIREFGLLNALGLKSVRVGGLVLAETAVLTLVSLVVGLAIALATHAAVAHWGIPISAFGVDEMELAGVDMADMVMGSQVSVPKWIVASLGVVLTTVGSASFAAVKAARLVPAEAMRFYE